MAQLDFNAYATTAANAAAGAANIIETQQPGGTGSGRQVMVVGDAVTRANMAKVDAAGNQAVNQPDVTTSGTLAAAAQVVVLALTGQSAASFQLSGTWVGTVTFEGSLDGTLWNNINAVASSTSFPQPTTTVNGLYRLTPGGLLQIRANMSAFTSGTVTVAGRASAGVGGTFANQILPIRLTDGISTQAIKSASTAAVATDPAAVVALHPSSPLPTGTNSIGKAAIDQTTNIIAATTMQNAAVAVGNGVNLNVQGYVSAIISITGTMGGGSRIDFEASVDDVTFVSIAGHQIGVSGALSVFTTTTGDFRISTAAYKSVRARVSVFGTGSMTAKGYVSAIPGHPTTMNTNIIAALPVGANTIGNVGIIGTVPVSLATNTPVIAAGTNTIGAVKIAGSVVSTVNSTAVVLAAAGVFTGTSEDVSQYASVTVQVFADVVSATDGLSMQQSINGTNWDNIDAYSIPAATGKNFGIHISANFFRLVYTNGATLQATFRLQTIYHVIANATSSVRPQDGRGNDNDMQEVIGYNAIYNGTTWDRLRGTNGSMSTLTSDGTNVANVLKADGTAAGQNSQLVSGAYKESTALSAAALNADLVISTDVSNYKWVSLQIITIATGGFINFYGSNDNTTFVLIPLTNTTSVNAAPNAGTGVTGIFTGATQYRYFRARQTGFTSGSTTGTVEFYAVPPSINNLAVSSSSPTGSGVPASAFAMGLSDGTNLQALRGNESVTLLASAARTVTATSADLLNYNGASIIDVILDMTVVGTGSVTVTINGKDPASGKYYLLLAGAAIVANSTNVYTLNPSLATAVTNVSAQKAIPRIFQIVVTANNANTATYSVGYNLMRG